MYDDQLERCMINHGRRMYAKSARACVMNKDGRMINMDERMMYARMIHQDIHCQFRTGVW